MVEWSAATWSAGNKITSCFVHFLSSLSVCPFIIYLLILIGAVGSGRLPSENKQTYRGLYDTDKKK